MGRSPKSKDKDDSPSSHTRQQDPLSRRPLHQSLTPPKSPKTRKHNQEIDDDRQISRGKRSPYPKKRLYPNLDDLNGEQSQNEDDLDADSSENEEQKKKSRVRSKPKMTPRRTERSPDNRVYKGKVEPQQDVVKTSESSSGSNFILIIAILCIIVAIAWMAMCGTQTEPSVPVQQSSISPADLFVKRFREIQPKFPSQKQRLWQVIGTAIKRVISEDPPTYPAVILLGVPQQEAATASCLARHVMQLVNSVLSKQAEVSVNCSRLTQASPAKTKLALDQQLKSILLTSGGVVLDDFNSLPAQGALLMHAYCDGDNAPFKEAVFIKVLNTNFSVSDLTDEAVEQYLNMLWETELGLDEMPALRSRIANNIAIVSPEKDFVCDI